MTAILSAVLWPARATEETAKKVATGLVAAAPLSSRGRIQGGCPSKEVASILALILALQ